MASMSASRKVDLRLLIHYGRKRSGTQITENFASTTRQPSIKLDGSSPYPFARGLDWEAVMSAKLVVIAGPCDGQVFELAADQKLMIGRADTANISLADPTISRAHCSIEVTGMKAILRDNASKSGTRVNGKTIVEHEMKEDEVINVGTTKMRFQFVVQLKTAPDEKLADSEDHEELRQLSGTKLAHFEVGTVVALGNSGVVFKAKDVKDNREVALKVYMPEFAEKDEDLQRFIRAVKTMLPMRHSNVVTLYGGGKTGPHCWMSMEYVEGESLKDTIARIGKKGKMDWRPAMRVATDITRGLHYIHGENIIHRSLSPGNILFSRLGIVKLGSLILAKALSGALAKDVTVGGNFLGEVNYLSPEQVGAGGSVDHRADIYSLGTLIYALLTGKTPFEGNSPLQTATWILQREPTSPKKINPDIPEQLEKVVLKMLAKNPDERYQNAADVLAELEQLYTK
jgi:tRNA A-37 threonylcarbamoyl transferase component Bud32